MEIKANLSQSLVEVEAELGKTLVRVRILGGILEPGLKSRKN